MIKDPKKAWNYVEEVLHKKLIQTKFKEHIDDIRITEVNYDLERRRDPWIEYKGKIILDSRSYDFIVQYSIGSKVSACFFDKQKRVFRINKQGYRKYQDYIETIKSFGKVTPLSKLYPNIWGVKSLKMD